MRPGSPGAWLGAGDRERFGVVTPDIKVPEAAQIMKKGGFRRLPVVKEGRVVGIVTDRDLKEAMPSDATSLSIWELNYLISKLTVG